MRIPSGGARLGVTQQRSYQGQAGAARGENARIGMPKVMDPGILDLRSSCDRRPCKSNLLQWLARLAAGEHVIGRAGVLWADTLQELPGRAAQRDSMLLLLFCMRAGFRPNARFHVDLPPGGMHGLAFPSAR